MHSRTRVRGDPRSSLGPGKCAKTLFTRLIRFVNLFWEKTLKTSTVEPSTSFWTLFCEETLKIGKNWNVNRLLDENRDCWHFHQLLHQLRHTKHGALWDAVLENSLGHFDNLLGNRQKRVKELEGHHLQGRNDACVPLHLPLRPLLSKRSRPHPSCGLTVSGSVAATCGGRVFQNLAV